MNQAKRIWGRLTDPSPSLQRQDRRRQAQLLASMLVCLILLTALGESFMALTPSSRAFSDLFWMIVSLAGLLVAYSLSRTRHYKAAAVLLIGVASVGTFVISIYGNDPPDLEFLAYLVLPILLSGVFLSLRTTAVLALFNLLGLLLLAPLSSKIPFTQVAAGPLIYFSIVAALILLADYYKNQLEQDRQIELAKSNAALKAEIAERERVESQREAALGALRESEEKYRLLVENTDDLICEIDAGGRFLFVNSQYHAMLGYELETLLGTSALELIHPDDLDRSQITLSGLVDSMVSSRDEWRIRHRDGQWRWVEFVATPYLKSPDDVRIVVTGRDVTERREMSRQLARSNAELQQFAYVASHDLREPLRMVGSYLALLEQDYAGALEPEAQEFIEFASDGATRMQRMIQGLLQYSRIQTRAQPMRPTDCETLLAQTLSDLSVAIDESGAVVTHDPLPTVPADAAQLARVFQNLIDNAIKFHEEASPRVHVSARREGGEWCFAVQDNGIGIDPAQTERIFEMFQRLHTQDEYEGTGIGLALCQKIVERHGGRIWVESEPGQGSTFYFSLPAGET